MADLSQYEINRLRQKERAHDDYMNAVKAMQHRMAVMANEAASGDPFARGWVAAMHEMSLAIQQELARRIA